MSDQTNIQVLKGLRKQIEEGFWPLLKRDRGREKTTKSLAYNTLLARGLKYTDLTTSHEKTPVSSAAMAVSPRFAATRHARVPINRILKQLKATFGERVDLHKLAGVPALKKEMNHSGMMLWASGPDGGNIHVSPLLEFYTGCPATQFRDGGWIELVHPEDQEKTLETFQKYFDKRKPVRVWYRLWRGLDACYAWIIDYAEPRFQDGDFVGYVGTMNEVHLLLFQWYMDSLKS